MNLFYFRRSHTNNIFQYVCNPAILITSFIAINVEGKGLTSYEDPFKLEATLTIEDARLISSLADEEIRTNSRPLSEQRVVVAFPLNFNLKSLFGYNLGEVTLLGLMIREDPDLNRGRTMINDAHAYSNLRAEDRAQLFEAYWHKNWGDTTLRLGKLDANDHFAVSEHEAHLISGAAGFSPSILGMPSYPDSAWSIQAMQRIYRFDLSVGIFDGASTSLRPVPTGSRLGWSEQVKRGGLFYVAQVAAHLGGDLNTQETITSEGRERVAAFQQDRQFEARAPLHITLGVWTHRGEVVQIDRLAKPASGLYLTSDLKLFDTSRGGEVGLGAQLALTEHIAPTHMSVAIVWTELIPPLAWSSRGPSLSVGLSQLSLKDQSKTTLIDSSERLIECTVAAPLSDSLLLSFSWITLSGDQLRNQGAQLFVSRLTLGTY